MSNKESFGKTVTVVVGVCLFCAVIVASAAVGLRTEQKENALLDKQTNILEAAGLLEKAQGDVKGTFDKYIETRILDLNTNEFVEGIDVTTYDQFRAARKDGMRPQPDVAKIIRRPNKVPVYMVKNEAGQLDSVVLPVNGAGLWDMMKAFIAVEADGNTVRSMIYYDQKETPGLGAEVLNPKWKALWAGKKLFDASGAPAIKIVKGGASQGDVHGVDALSGATLTSNGVQNTLTYWLGNEGFGPFLVKVRNGGL